MAPLIAVCNTVGYARSEDVIHRDLKGSNFVLGEFGQVIVLDWGFARDQNRSPNPMDGPTRTRCDRHYGELWIPSRII